MENDIGFEMRKLCNLIKRKMLSNESICSHKTTKVQYEVIKYLGDNNDKDIFQKDIEKEFSLRAATVSQLLKTMEEKGLIEKHAVKSDGRVKKIIATKKATQINNQFCGEYKKHRDVLLEGIDKQNIDICMNVIKKMQENIINNTDK